MAILTSCCCWRSVRNGSFASGFYTLIYYSILVVGGTFQVDSTVMSHNDTVTAHNSAGHTSAAPLSFTVSVVACAGTSVLASVVLLVGLCVDNRLMLIPWISSIAVTTFICFVYSIYLIATTSFKPILAAIFTLDFFLSLLNVYCLLCVVSQYQEYKAGRGRSEDTSGFYQPPVKYDSWAPPFYSAKRSNALQKDRLAPPGKIVSTGQMETKSMLVHDEATSSVDGDEWKAKPRIHFQEPEDSSWTLSSNRSVGFVLKDGSSTDTASSKLPSEIDPSPRSRTKHVKFCGAKDNEEDVSLVEICDNSSNEKK